MGFLDKVKERFGQKNVSHSRATDAAMERRNTNYEVENLQNKIKVEEARARLARAQASRGKAEQTKSRYNPSGMGEALFGPGFATQKKKSRTYNAITGWD